AADREERGIELAVDVLTEPAVGRRLHRDARPGAGGEEEVYEVTHPGIVQTPAHRRQSCPTLHPPTHTRGTIPMPVPPEREVYCPTGRFSPGRFVPLYALV